MHRRVELHLWAKLGSEQLRRWRLRWWAARATLRCVVGVVVRRRRRRCVGDMFADRDGSVA